MREIEDEAVAGNERAALALKMFIYRIRKYIGSYAAAMGGLTTVVFTGGIGENSAIVRRGVLEGLEFLGVKLDEKLNDGMERGSESVISASDSPAGVYVIPTNEELVIALETVNLVNEQA